MVWTNKVDNNTCTSIQHHKNKEQNDAHGSIYMNNHMFDKQRGVALLPECEQQKRQHHEAKTREDKLPTPFVSIINTVERCCT